jgi:hypothetical protein
MQEAQQKLKYKKIHYRVEDDEMESIKKSKHEFNLAKLNKAIVATKEDSSISLIKIHKFIISRFA